MAKQKSTLPVVGQATSIVPAAAPDPVAGPLAKFTSGLPAGWFFSSFPLTTVEEVSRAMYEVEIAVSRLWDKRDQTLLIRDVAVIMSDEEDEETGEVRMVKRLIVWDHKGKGYQTPSKPARNSLARQLARLAQPPFNRLPPYDPPLPVEIIPQKSANAGKGDWLHLVVRFGEESTVVNA